MGRKVIKIGKAAKSVKSQQQPRPQHRTRRSDSHTDIAVTNPYRNGAEGFFSWVEDNCRLPIYPPDSDIPQWKYVHEFDEGYRKMWEQQKAEIAPGLEMKKGRFIYNLIILCWMRGEGKSLVLCLIEMWKWFCWPKQNIVLGANSKEQTKFVHYDIMRDIILNSPSLLAKVGMKNIQEKEIRIKNAAGNIVSTIRAVSSFSGIVSNANGFTFSEMFDMKNPKFFTQLYGSIRNVPNALGGIDSTVSDLQHILYQLYQNTREGKSKLVFFSYRSSPNGREEDFWNPNMTQAQLDNYRDTMLVSDFDRYFRNTWGSGGAKVFSYEMVEAINYLGLDNRPVPQIELVKLISERNTLIRTQEDLISRGLEVGDVLSSITKIADMNHRFWPVSDVYTFDDHSDNHAIATMEDLERLSEYHDTDWAILAGGDRADPMKVQLGARTIFTVVAKGLAGSRSNPYRTAGEATKFIYYLLGIWYLAQHTLEEVKAILREVSGVFDGIDRLTVERWGMWDLKPWCDENDITFDPVFPTYDKQKAAFTELFLAVRDGRFKTPPVPMPGSKGNDLIKEELLSFDHDPIKRWFGSPEKRERHGVQDDAIYSMGWGMYGGRELGVETFRPRRKAMGFGDMFMNKDLSARW
jgi:hypothetical protein